MAHLSDLENVLCGRNVVGHAVDGQYVVWESADLRAVDFLARADFGDDWINQGLASHHQGCASVNDTIEVGWSYGLGSEFLVVYSDEPVGLRFQLVVIEISSVISWVRSAEHKSGSFGSWLVGQEEGEGRLLNLGLLNGLVENGREIVHGDFLPSHTIERRGGEIEAQVSHLSETNISNRDASPAHSVESDLAVHVA